MARLCVGCTKTFSYYPWQSFERHFTLSYLERRASTESSGSASRDYHAKIPGPGGGYQPDSFGPCQDSRPPVFVWPGAKTSAETSRTQADYC
ncbi:Protein of unknown function [Cotesia congregata]|uniref:Uncharacterized protein n=1 Tax=Cotesia congregata TaxID=51543 RepID=A0A8J2H0F9_COTCN|nr:Protein of unknown function [Cotesia congregata]